MSSNERKAIKTAQQVYKIGNKQTELTAEEKKEDEEALALFNQLRNKNSVREPKSRITCVTACNWLCF